MSTPALRVNEVMYPDGTNAGGHVYDVKAPEYGAKGDGTTDDTAAIQAAVTAAETSGGTVFFPSGRYKITSEIDVKSLYPVNLIGEFNGFSDNISTGVFIMPGANFGSTSMFRYQAPAGTAHTAHGAGLIRGLSFYDPFNAPGHTGNYTMLAALDLYDFSLGSVENCMFHVLNGGAIRIVNMVMGSMRDVVIRYCGTGSQAALSLEPAGGGAVQSTSFSDLRMEVNYGTYLSINSTAAEDKFVNLGFEADTSVAGSNNTFIDNSGQEMFFANVHMNRNTATQLKFESASNFGTMTNVYIADNSTKTGNSSAIINGANHQISNLNISGATAQTTCALSVLGSYGTYKGIEVLNSGGITIGSSAYNQFENVFHSGMVSGSGTYAFDFNGGIHSRLAGCIIKSLPANAGGIRVTGSAGPMAVSNCEVRDVTGTGVAFRDENSSNTTTWINNHSFGNSADFSATATAYQSIGNSWGNGTIAGVIVATLASATTIAPTKPVTHITGTTTIQTITAPSAFTTTGNGGQITLVFDGIAPWNAAGNIAVAGTPTTAGTSVVFTYDAATSKWYPSRLA